MVSNNNIQLAPMTKMGTNNTILSTVVTGKARVRDYRTTTMASSCMDTREGSRASWVV